MHGPLGFPLYVHNAIVPVWRTDEYVGLNCRGMCREAFFLLQMYPSTTSLSAQNLTASNFRSSSSWMRSAISAARMAAQRLSLGIVGLDWVAGLA